MNEFTPHHGEWVSVKIRRSTADRINAFCGRHGRNKDKIIDDIVGMYMDKVEEREKQKKENSHPPVKEDKFKKQEGN